MSVNIINSLSTEIQVPISYGLDIELQFTGTIGFRNKIGVDIELNSKFIGAVEVDFSQTSTSYFVTIDLIKQYIEKHDSQSGQAGMVDDISQLIKLTPYTKSRPDGGVWTAKVYGNSKSFYAVRGVFDEYYLDGNKTPHYPMGSSFFNESLGTSGSFSHSTSIPKGSFKRFYYAIDETYGEAGRGINGTITHMGYHTNTPNGIAPINVYSLSESIVIDSKNRTAYLDVSDMEIAGYTATGVVVKFDDVISTGGGPITMVDWTVIVDYNCVPNWDFQVDLLFIDNTFNWSTIPFYVKNKNSITREVNTIEDYNYAKKDYNLKARRVFDLKSDYMTKRKMDEILLFGITPEIKVKTQTGDIQDARLLSSSVPVVSGKNETMYQLEIQVEISELILTP